MRSRMCIEGQRLSRSPQSAWEMFRFESLERKLHFPRPRLMVVIIHVRRGERRVAIEIIAIVMDKSASFMPLSISVILLKVSGVPAHFFRGGFLCHDP